MAKEFLGTLNLANRVVFSVMLQKWIDQPHVLERCENCVDHLSIHNK